MKRAREIEQEEDATQSSDSDGLTEDLDDEFIDEEEADSSSQLEIESQDSEDDDQSSMTKSSGLTGEPTASTDEQQIWHEYKDLDNWSTSPPPLFPRHLPEPPGPGFRPGMWDRRPVQSQNGYDIEDYWFYLWNPAWYRQIADRTNIYRATIIPPKRQNSTIWRETDAEEIMSLHGILIYMGIKKFIGGFSAYFKPDPWGDPWVKKIFSMGRFWVLMRIFKVVENSLDYGDNEDLTDPTLKVKLWYDLITAQLQECWYPHRVICLDESMTKATSKRNPIRQRMSCKPIPVGAKSWRAVDGAGVAIWSSLYRGARMGEEIGLSHWVVRQLLSRLRTTGHCIITDNFYGSFESFDDITAAGNTCLLMIRRPRKVPETSPLWTTNPVYKLSTIVDKKQPRGSRVAAWFKDRCMLTIWRDNELVVLLTNECTDGSGKTGTVTRNAAGHQPVEIASSTAVELYNEWKSFVDRFNCKKAEAELITFFRRWWKRVFFNDIWAAAEASAWGMMRWHLGSLGRPIKQLCIRSFRQRLAEVLVLPQQQKNSAPPIQLAHSHELERTEKRRVCSACRSRGASFKCRICGLCFHISCATKTEK